MNGAVEIFIRERIIEEVALEGTGREIDPPVQHTVEIFFEFRVVPFGGRIKIANGIRADHEDLEVDNCELWAWNKWAIDLAVAGGALLFLR